MFYHSVSFQKELLPCFFSLIKPKFFNSCSSLRIILADGRLSSFSMIIFTLSQLCSLNRDKITFCLGLSLPLAVSSFLKWHCCAPIDSLNLNVTEKPLEYSSKTGPLCQVSCPLVNKLFMLNNHLVLFNVVGQIHFTLMINDRISLISRAS